MTDNNQVSEDELDKILNWHSHCREEINTKAPGWADPKYAEMQYQTIVACHRNEAREAIQSLIRTEKLKLLAEVRERVVGENQHSEHKEWDCPCGATHSFTEEWHATNRLRDEQRVALTKLEAEL